MSTPDVDFDLIAILAEAANHGSLRVTTIPAPSGDVTRLVLIPAHSGEQEAGFWLLGNVLVRFAWGIGQPRESFWVLGEGNLARLRVVIAHAQPHYGRG